MNNFFAKHKRFLTIAAAFMVAVSIVGYFTQINLTDMNKAVMDKTTPVLPQVHDYFLVANQTGGAITESTTTEATQRHYVPDSSSASYIELTKIAEETGTENQFQITLTVKTNSELVKPSVGTVILLDMSQSMTNTVSNNKSRLEYAADALNTLISGLAAIETGDADNKVAMLTFNSTVTYFYDGFTSTKDAADNALSVSSGSSSSSSHGGGHGEGGGGSTTTLTDNNGHSATTSTGTYLYSAMSALQTFLSENNATDTYDVLNVIVVTDGVPGDSDSSAASSLKSYCEDSDAAIYGVYIGDEDSSATSVVKSVVTDDGEFFDASSDQAGMSTAFANLANSIQNKINVWKVEDNMGTMMDYTEKSHNKSADSGVITEESAQIDWSLLMDEPLETTKLYDEFGNQIGTEYTYQVTYNASMNTLADGYKAGEDQSYATNGATGLSYYVLDASGNKTSGNVWFNSPAVYGYDADFKILKTDEYGNPLKGAKFDLVAVSDSSWTYSAKENSGSYVESDENGVVTFEDVPSGQSYILKEISAPDGYVKSTDEHTVKISWGKVYMDGSETEYEDLSLVYTNTTKVRNDLTISKVWDDDSNRDGIRPSSVTVELYSSIDSGKTWKDTEKSYTLSEDNSWTTTIEVGDTDVYTYKVEEAAITAKTASGSGYTTSYDSSVDDNGDMTLTVTNKHIIDTIKITVKKVWDDNNDEDGLRVATAKLQILADGTAVDSKTVKTSNSSYTFSDLPVYSNGTKIEYTVDEVLGDLGKYYVATYSSETDDSGNITCTVTNSHTPGTVNVPVEKVWNDDDDNDGKRPDSITVNLLANGTATGDTLTITEDDGWSGVFEALPEKLGGISITYSFEEVVPDGYTATYSGDTVTNTHTNETVPFNITVEWVDDDDKDGKRPDEVTITIYADGEEVTTITVSSSDNWKDTVTNLPKYKDGKEINYTVVQTDVDGYSTTVSGNTTSGFVVTNTISGETPKVSIPVTVTWDDDDDRDGKRPDSVTITVYANGEDTGITITLTPDDDWSTTITNLPKYDSDGNEITYTITETTPDGYTVTVGGDSTTGFSVTNKHTPETVTSKITVTWSDNNNRDGKRPDYVTIKVYANGKDTGITITVSADSDWTALLNLPKYENGEEIKYTFTEVTPDGYESKISGNLTDGLVFTNNRIVTATVTATGEGDSKITAAGVLMLVMALLGMTAYITRKIKKQS